MVNKYFIGSHISERKFRQIVRFFCLDIEAKKTAELTGISRQSINKIYAAIRHRIVDICSVPIQPTIGEFELDEIGEAFILRPGVKGLVWVNGFNLGRYWNIGPTETLYIPSPVLKKGKNEVIILELEKLDSATINFSPELRLGPTE